MKNISNHEPCAGRSQQSNITTGIRDGWLPLKPFFSWIRLQAGGGGGVGVGGVMVFAVTGANIMCAEEAAGHSVLIQTRPESPEPAQQAGVFKNLN